MKVARDSPGDEKGSIAERASVEVDRTGSGAPVGLVDPAGRPLSFSTPPVLLRVLHLLDRSRAEGRIDDRVVRCQMDEAVASVRLAGIEIAAAGAMREFLRSGREPENEIERAVGGVFSVFESLARSREAPVTEDDLSEFARRVAGQTVGVREPEYARRVARLLVEKPDREDADGFVHPLIRGLAAHLAILAFKPFAEANGRIARALFFDFAVSEGYRVFLTLPWCQVMTRDPSRYEQAAARVLGEENDLTEFLIHQARILSLALDEAAETRERSAASASTPVAGDEPALNRRQRALLAHAARHPGYRYTIAGHRRSHGVVYQTARTDLLDLAERGLLGVSKVGRAMVFSAARSADTAETSRTLEVHFDPTMD